MRVFVTGGTGFVGSHVVERLLEAGHAPVCLVRETSDCAHLDGLRVEQVVGSMSKPEALAEVLSGVQAVIHIAGVIKAKSFDNFYKVNGECAGRLAQTAAKANPGLKRFVQVSSIAAQGPSPGSAARCVTLEPAPVSHYGRSKLQGEQAVLELADQMAVSVVRPPAVYGPRDHEMLQVFKMAQLGLAPLYGKGDGVVSLIHAFDLADAIVRCVEVEHESGSIFTVDDGEQYSWAQMSDHIAAALGKRALKVKIPAFVFHGAARLSEAYGRVANKSVIFTRDKVAEMKQTSWVCGHEAIGEALEWAPKWPLERGAVQAARWYREAGWL